MIRRAALLLAITALLAIPGTALAAESFTAELTVDAEVPPVTAPSEGSGEAEATINTAGTSISYNVSYEGLTGDAAAAHIHYGAPGEAGGVMLPLAVGPSPFSGTLTEADFTPVDGGPQTFAEALDAIREGDAYINIHTAANAPGEVRGQLEPADLPPTDEVTGTGPASLPLLPALVAAGVVGLALAFRRGWVTR